MTDQYTSNFPKVGTVNANPVVAAPERGTPVPKGNASGAGVPDAGTATHRGGVQESLGHKGAPQMQHCYPNDPGASLTQRNVYLIARSNGTGDQFYAKRAYGQVLQ